MTCVLLLFIAILSIPPVWILARHTNNSASKHLSVAILFFIVGALLVLIVVLPLMFLFMYFIYRALFVEYISRYTRPIFGVEGYLTGYVFFLHLLGAFRIFPLLYLGPLYNKGWDGPGTYKPGWADMLG